MTIRVAAEGVAYLVDDSYTPPRVVGIKQPDGTEYYFSLVTSQPSAYPANNSVVTGQVFDTATTAQLTAIGNAINTTNKYAGKIVRNTTTGRYVQALDATAGGTWNSLADGTTAVHTPA